MRKITILIPVWDSIVDYSGGGYLTLDSFKIVSSVTNEGKPLACIVATKRACSLVLTLYHVIVTCRKRSIVRD